MKGISTVFFISLVFILLVACNERVVHDEELARGFENPGVEARPRAYWNWLNGDVSLSGITRDLEEAKDKGLGGLQIWDTGALNNPDGFVPEGPPFLGEESLRAIQHAMKEAQRLDLELGLICASGWNSGGAWITPEMASKNLFHAGTIKVGPGKVHLSVPFPEVPEGCPKGSDGLPLWYMDIAVLAWPVDSSRGIVDISSVVDLTDKLENGILSWDVPQGKWQIERFVCTNNGQELIAASPQSKGLFIDFLDPEATRFHFEYIFKKLGLEKGVKGNLPLKTLDDDSMELHAGIQWTGGFERSFFNQHEYSPIKWLPVFLGFEVESREQSERFLYDYRQTVSDLLIFSHYTTGSRVCEEYDVELVAEAGGPGPPFWESCPVDALKALGNVHIPRGEFWMGNPRNLFLIKEIASASHIYGKKYVDAESWTTWRRWRDGPFERKMLVDRAFAEGLNRVTYHGFSHSPVQDQFPGRSYHAGVDMNPQVVWWSKARPFMDYLARCSFMLQQGLYVADVAYYYGDQAPNFWPLFHNVPEKPSISGLGPGYEYDVVNSDVILNRMDVKNGRIVLPDGMSYRLLVLPDQKTMPLEVLLKFEALVAKGATILGPKPSEVPGRMDAQSKTVSLRNLADKMWGGSDGYKVKVNSYGKGKIVYGYTAEQWLKESGVGPDFTTLNPELSSNFDFIHRETDLSHIYFISNKTLKQLNTECSFRVENSAPQIWDPSDGSMSDQFIFNNKDRGITMPISLPPGGATFVVFNKEKVHSGLNSVVKEVPKNGDFPVEKVLEVNGESILMEFWQNGKYMVETKKGKQFQIFVDYIPSPKPIDGSWTVEFDPKLGAPEKIVFPGLISWTEHEDAEIKHYSGKGTYTKSITVKNEWIGDEKNIYLDLGGVGEVAEIFINGNSVGVVWKPPFSANITEFLKPGENELKVEVVNLWINRLTGDKELPEAER